MSKRFELNPISENYPICTTGDVVAGDEIRFFENVFEGSWRSPRFKGTRVVEARVLSESYGDEKHQHTFSLEIVHSEGTDPLTVGKKTRRKGRNIYRNGTARKFWDNERERDGVADEKHERGDEHRQLRKVAFAG